MEVLFLAYSTLRACNGEWLAWVLDFLDGHFENCVTRGVLSKRMPNQNIIRQRNKRSFHLFLRNLKESLVCVQVIGFLNRGFDRGDYAAAARPYTTVTLNLSMTYLPRWTTLPEHLRRVKSYVQSLQSLLVSCETAASSAQNSVSFYPQPRVEGQGPGRPTLNVTKEEI